MQQVCRLPRTATRRSAISYAKILDGVDAEAVDGFGYRGRVFKPGAAIAPEPNLVVLECTEVEGDHATRKRKLWEKIYILWRYDPERSEWVELARVQSESGDWARLLREAARVALGRASWAIVPKIADVVTRIRQALDQELDGLEISQRGKVVAQLHDEFAARMADAGVA